MLWRLEQNIETIVMKNYFQSYDEKTYTVTKEQELLERQAYQSFLKGNFDACFVTLNILNNTDIFETSLSNNLALVDFERCNRADVTKYIQALTKVMATFELKLDEIASFKAYDHFTLLYNYCVCMYYQGKRKEIVKFVEILYANLEFATDMCLINILIMLASLYIEIKNYSEALSVLNKLERFIINDENDMVFKPINKESDGEKDEDRFSAGRVECDALKSNIFYLRFICFISVRNFREARNQLLGIKSDPAIKSLCSACFEYFCGNSSQSFKHLTEWSKICDDKNAEVRNLNKVILLNNASCVYGSLYQFDIGSLCCAKALDFNNKLMYKTENKNEKKNTGLVNYSSKIKTNILYNCGLHSLFSGNVVMASKYFAALLKSCNHSPLVWLRFSECCMYSLKKNTKPLFSLELEPEHLGSHIISQLSPNAFSDYVFNCEQQRQSQCDSLTASTSALSCVSFCTMALLNSLYCLGNKSDELPNSSNINDDVLIYNVDPCTPITTSTLVKLKSLIFTDLAFCYLILGNYIMCSHFATKVLQSSFVSSNQKIPCTLYNAECLTVFENFDEALDLLKRCLAAQRDKAATAAPVECDTQNSAFSSFRKLLRNRWTDMYFTENVIVDPHLLTGIISYNIAIIYGMKNENEKVLDYMKIFERVFGNYQPNPIFTFKCDQEYLTGSVTDIMKTSKNNPL